MSLQHLIDDERIQTIRPDSTAGSVMLAEAKRHLESARVIAEVDPNGSYSLLYDAARKAVAAHMHASGYRATKKQLGAHASVVAYAEIEISKGEFKKDVANFDRMRRNRNRSEYGVALFGQAEINKDLGHAQRIVDAVEANWPGT